MLASYNGAGFLIVWLQVFGDTFRTDNREPAPFFLYCLQKENMMAVPRRIFKKVIDTLTTDSFFKKESSNEYPEVYLPDFIEEIIKEHPLTWENISERI